jgi:hypothetical protein
LILLVIPITLVGSRRSNRRVTMFRLRRREIGLMTLTALVCFGVAIPLTGAAAGNGHGTVAIPPGGSVSFVGLDLKCGSFAPETALDQKGEKRIVPLRVDCYRASGDGVHKGLEGVWTQVTRSKIVVQRCTFGIPACPLLGSWSRAK